MDITRYTKLTDLVPSDDITADMQALNTKIGTILDDRQSVIESHMSGAFSVDKTVNGSTIFYNVATIASTKYKGLSQSLETIASSISSLSVAKEIEELNELKDRVQEAINECQYGATQGDYDGDLKGIEDYEIDIKNAKNSYQETMYENSKRNKITEKATWETKMKNINNRLSELGVAPSTSGAGINDGSSDTGSGSNGTDPGNGAGNNTNNDSNKDNNTNDDNNKTKTSIEHSKGDEIEDGKHTIYEGKAGERITYDGKKYKIQGYTDDGTCVYNNSGAMYTRDENGNMVEVEQKFEQVEGCEIKKYIVNGKEVNVYKLNDTPQGYSSASNTVSANFYTAKTGDYVNANGDDYLIKGQYTNSDGKTISIYAPGYWTNDTYKFTYYDEATGNMKDGEVLCNSWGTPKYYKIDGVDYPAEDFK